MNHKLYNYIIDNNMKKTEQTFCEMFASIHQNKNIMDGIEEVISEQTCYVNYSILVEEFILLDIYEFFKENKDSFTYDFIDFYSFGKALESYNFRQNNMTIGIGYTNEADYDPKHKFIFNIICKDDSFFKKNESGKQEFFIFVNDISSSYTKENFSKTMFQYIDCIRKRYKRSEIVFYYIYQNIMNETDITSFFGCHKSKDIIRIHEYEKNAPINEKGFYSAREGIIIEKKGFFIVGSYKNKEILFKQDARLISKINYNSKFAPLLIEAINYINNKRRYIYDNIWQESFKNEIRKSLQISNLDFINIQVEDTENYSCFLKSKIYSTVPNVVISFEFINDKIFLKNDYSYWDIEKQIRKNYSNYLMIKEAHDEKNSINAMMKLDADTTHKNKRI